MSDNKENNKDSNNIFSKISCGGKQKSKDETDSEDLFSSDSDSNEEDDSQMDDPSPKVDYKQKLPAMDHPEVQKGVDLLKQG